MCVYGYENWYRMKTPFFPRILLLPTGALWSLLGTPSFPEYPFSPMAGGLIKPYLTSLNHSSNSIPHIYCSPSQAADLVLAIMCLSAPHLHLLGSSEAPGHQIPAGVSVSSCLQLTVPMLSSAFPPTPPHALQGNFYSLLCVWRNIWRQQRLSMFCVVT